MRNGQNKRMRGRNRKSQNPMTRVFESNGPDVKIRGTPSHIAEKYLQLARDAQTSGDPVAAENYFQHAEHYFRLIAAAQEQFRQSNPQFYRGENETRDMRDDGFDDGDDSPQGMPGPGEVPFGPGEPGSPFRPCSPCGPCSPCEPGGPIVPCGPMGPATPAGPTGPAGPSTPLTGRSLTNSGRIPTITLPSGAAARSLA